MNLRCPYCRAGLAPDDQVRCADCRAPAHTACALELGRCASCSSCSSSRWLGLGPGELADWEWVPGEPLGEAYLRALPPGPAEIGGARPKLRLDLQRQREPVHGLLAGTAILIVPVAQPLGLLSLELSSTRACAGLLGVRRRRAVERRIRLLGPTAAPRWRRRRLRLYEAGCYAIDFRLPLTGWSDAGDPGDARASLVLDRAQDRLRLSLPFWIEPTDVGEGFTPSLGCQRPAQIGGRG